MKTKKIEYSKFLFSLFPTVEFTEFEQYVALEGLVFVKLI